ncbi:Na+/H+ antiporter NhaC family protein [Sinanaerobacter sp. ZZT-01]|uniref:Na+/H+ antiporter NhaC family protein n=1 Tax=Sinanaerobacter sp. ZZT-01 TaxID=3111540 RepID=UPI002D791651|nr:Na+/H+ antiporter NhaC family protein [Sinanaerobacter sp. ZZT-01]WRR92602.1 Na+/H+ antiporter NhaC family protein [Sinanaerobacter sp. ZZT-01]
MDILIGLFLCFLLLMIAVQKGFFLGYALFLCWIIFTCIAKKKGKTNKEILLMSYEGGKRSFLILQIFLLIGCIMSVWITAGTLPTLMYYCLNYIAPNWFVLFSFLICALISFLIGSSFGAVSTMGIALITLARGGNIPLSLMTGAIMSGVYFGDRGSPVSSAAALTATVTNVEHMTNVKNMSLSCILPFLLSIVFYGGFSLFHPLKLANSPLPSALTTSFVISPLMLIPALILFLLPVLKVGVKSSMFLSILSALLLSLTIQKATFLSVLKAMLLGVTFESGPLSGVLSSGGIRSMLITYVMLFISCSLAGIFECIHAFESLEILIQKYNRSPRRRFGLTAIVGMLSCAFGCNQTIATIITHDIMKPCYKDTEQNQFALDISNSTIIIAGLIPWCVASFVPISMLGVHNAAYLPFAFYMYSIPISSFLLFPISGKAKF